MVPRRRVLVALVSVVLAAAVGAPVAAAQRPTPTPPVALGPGSEADVLVDEAGTAHIAFMEDGGEGPDVLRYCRLPRRAAACDNPPATQRLVPAQDLDAFPGNNPRGNLDTFGPRVVRIGDDLGILTARCCNVVRHPDGELRDRTTYLYLSADGGESFSEPGIVGTAVPSFGVVVWGTDEEPRITITEENRGEIRAQTIEAGRYTARAAVLDTAADGFFISGVAVEGGLPVFAVGNVRETRLRRYTGAGDPNDAASWTAPVTVPGDLVELVDGPDGPHMLSIGRRPGTLQLDRIVPGGGTERVGAPPRVNVGHVVQDGGGRFVSVGVDAFGDAFALVSPDGVSWPDPERPGGEPVANIGAPRGGEPTAAAATEDGGGFLVAVADPGTVVAVPFGPQVRTGRPGLAGRAGGGLPAGAVAGCEVRVGGVRVAPDAGGCLLGERGARRRISTGPVNFNGLTIVPDPGVRIRVDARSGVVDSTGRVRVLARRAPIDVLLHEGRLDLRLPTRAQAAQQSRDGMLLGVMNVERARSIMAGFRLRGSAHVVLSGEGTRIPVTVELPSIFKGSRADAMLSTDRGGLKLESLQMELGGAALGPVEVGFKINWQRVDTRWGGELELEVDGAFELEVEAEFARGEFVSGDVKASPPFPGLPLDKFAVFYLTGAGLGLGLDERVELRGSTTFGILPGPGRHLIGAEGQVALAVPRDPGPVELRATGIGKLFDLVPMNSSELVFRTNGFLSLRGGLALGSREKGGIFSTVGLAFDLPRKLFQGEAVAEACAPLGLDAFCGGTSALVSNTGIAACVKLVTVGYRWGQSLPGGLSFDIGCDLEPYRVPVGATAAQDGPTAFTVPSGATAMRVRVTGAGGALPSVVLVGPGGARLTPAPLTGTDADAQAPALLMADPAAGQAQVLLQRPAAGRWRVEAQPGSPEVARLETGAGLPPAAISGSVRRGALRYRVQRRPGERVTFVDEGPEGDWVLGRARRASGSLALDAPIARGGRHTVVALVERGGLPVRRVRVASYTARTPGRPARVRGLRVRRVRGGVRATWNAVPGATRYRVDLRTGLGRRVTELVPAARRPALRFADVARGVRAIVTVRALAANGRAGRPATVRRR